MQQTATGSIEIQGHRGARGIFPENTIAGFRYALELGIPTLEMDTVITADGEVVVSHEPYMSAAICTHPDGRPVSAAEQHALRIFGMTYEEVARYDCGRRGNPRFKTQRPVPAQKPLLRDVIRMCEEHSRTIGRPAPQYNVETKCRPAGDGRDHPDPDVFTRKVVSVLQEAGVLSRTILQSFDPRTLQVARRILPDLRLSLLVEKSRDPGLGQALTILGFTPEIYSPEYVLVNAALIAGARQAGMRVIPWTVNTADEMRTLARLGVDGLITDYPDLALKTL